MNKEVYKRVSKEFVGLCKKYDKLNIFIKSKNFTGLDKDHRNLLYKQSKTMSDYIKILTQRLEKLK